VLAVGASYDEQATYRAQGLDAFLDIPFTEMMALTTQVDYIRWMPGSIGTALSDTADWVVEAGIYFPSIKLQPFVQYEDQRLESGLASDTRYFQGGVGYYFAGYNGNLKVSGGFKDTGVTYANEITLQLQGFYF